MIPKLRESMKIDRAEMRLRVSVEAKEAKHMHDRLKSMFKSVEVEDWDQGNLEIVEFSPDFKFFTACTCFCLYFVSLKTSLNRCQRLLYVRMVEILPTAATRSQNYLWFIFSGTA